MPPRPSLAVLPFANLTGDPKEDYFVDGLVDEIITALVQAALVLRHRPQYELHYKGRIVDVREVSRELGVRYVLEGSVRKAGDRRAGHRPAPRRRRPAPTSGPSR